MTKTIAVLQMLARLLGVVQIVVGIAIWIGWTVAIPFHSAVGGLFVLVLWIIAVIALFALPRRFVALFALLWGGLVLWLGMAQLTLLGGGMHWAVRLVHLLVGIAAIGLAESLATAVRRHWAARAD